MSLLATKMLRLACRLHQRWTGKPLPSLPRSATPRSLVIVSNTALGDTLLSTPVVHSARASWPESHIAFVVHPRYEALFAGLPGADQLITYDGGYAKLPRVAREIRKLRPDAVLLAHSNGPQDVPLAVFSGAAWVLKAGSGRGFRGLLTPRPAHAGEHVIEQRTDLVRLLGGTRIETRMRLPPRYLESAQVVPALPHPVIGLQLGAANHYKMWPIARFAELARRLLNDDPSLYLVATGSAAEKKLAQTLAAQVASPRLLDHCGHYPVERLPWFLRQLDLLVTNDTGTLHLAVALGVPTVSLFGLTSARLIGPYQDLDRHTVIQAQVPSQEHLPKKKRTLAGMEAIGVETVYQAVTERLGRRP